MMKQEKFNLVVAVCRGKVYYQNNVGGWTPHRDGAKEYATLKLAQREMEQHWHWDVQFSTRTESRRAKL
jgi:hypothetical protein